MAMINESISDNIGGGYGLGGFGAGGALIAFLVIILVIWLLFDRRDGHRGGNEGGYGYGHGYGHECGIHAVRPGYYDESNYEQDYKNLKEFDKVDRDVILGNEKILNKMAETEINLLKEKLYEKTAVIQKLEGEKFLTASLMPINAKLADLECNVPKRRPEWAQTVLPCASTIPNNCARPHGCGEEFAF